MKEYPTQEVDSSRKVDLTEAFLDRILHVLDEISGRLLTIENALLPGRTINPAEIGKEIKPIKVRTRITSVGELTHLLEKKSLEAARLLHTGEEISGAKE